MYIVFLVGFYFLKMIVDEIQWNILRIYQVLTFVFTRFAYIQYSHFLLVHGISQLVFVY